MWSRLESSSAPEAERALAGADHRRPRTEVCREAGRDWPGNEGREGSAGEAGSDPEVAESGGAGEGVSGVWKSSYIGVFWISEGSNNDFTQNYMKSGFRENLGFPMNAVRGWESEGGLGCGKSGSQKLEDLTTIG